MKEIAGQHAITVPIRKDWDSDFFGFPVGAVTLPGSVDAASVVRSVEEWRRSGFRLMYVFAEEPVEADVRSAVEKAGAVAFGSKVVYRKSCVGSTGRVPRTSHAVSTGSAALEDLACASGEHSRFLRDERLRPSFRRLYVKWLEKELANGKVFVSSDAESPEGLATVSLARGADDAEVKRRQKVEQLYAANADVLMEAGQRRDEMKQAMEQIKPLGKQIKDWFDPETIGVKSRSHYYDEFGVRHDKEEKYTDQEWWSIVQGKTIAQGKQGAAQSALEQLQESLAGLKAPSMD